MFLNVCLLYNSTQDHERAIEKEKLEYLESVRQVEVAEAQLKAVTEKYQRALDKFNSYQRDNKEAIDLFNEQMNILCEWGVVGVGQRRVGVSF